VHGIWLEIYPRNYVQGMASQAPDWSSAVQSAARVLVFFLPHYVRNRSWPIYQKNTERNINGDTDSAVHPHSSGAMCSCSLSRNVTKEINSYYSNFCCLPHGSMGICFIRGRCTWVFPSLNVLWLPETCQFSTLTLISSVIQSLRLWIPSLLIFYRYLCLLYDATWYIVSCLH
jgi:hypothetical protein